MSSAVSQARVRHYAALPLPPADRLTAVFAAGLGALPHATRHALLLVAAAEGTDRGATIKALSGLDPAVLTPAEEQGLLTVTAEAVGFRHPDIRSAVYHSVPFASRAAAHRELAEVLRDQPDRHAWHLGAAVLQPDENLASLLTQQRWSEAFTDPDGEAFAATVSPDVELNGSVFARPVHGRHTAWAVLRAASDVYDSLTFTSEAVSGDRVFLEWTATALGMRIDGVTVLVLDEQGVFAKVFVHHRLLAVVLAFSDEMAKRLGAGPSADHFYRVP